MVLLMDGTDFNLLCSKYLSDPTEDVRIATENQLGEFLREIREVTIVRKVKEEQYRAHEAEQAERSRPDAEKEKLSDVNPPQADPAVFLRNSESALDENDNEKINGADESDIPERDTGGTCTAIS